MIVSVFKSRYSNGSDLYPPQYVQIEVGNSPTDFFYKSQIFEVDQKSDAEQIFSIFPDLVFGTFIKVNLIGKPGIQMTDQKHY